MAMAVNGPETTVILSSSPEMVKDVFQSTPFQFGIVLLSIWVLIIFSNEAAVTEIKRLLEENIAPLDMRCGLPE
jgi:hypothetical protein